MDIGDYHMENNQGVTSQDFDKFFSWRGEISDWWTTQAAARYQASHVIQLVI